VAGHPAGDALRRSHTPGDLFIVGCRVGSVIGRPPYLRRSSSGQEPRAISKQDLSRHRISPGGSARKDQTSAYYYSRT